MGILKEERDRLKRLRDKYSEELKKLPHQTIQIKKRNNLEYVYLVHREGNHLKFDYIGPAKSKEAIDYLNKSSQKKELKIKLKKVEKDLKEIEKIVRKQN